MQLKLKLTTRQGNYATMLVEGKYVYFGKILYCYRKDISKNEYASSRMKNK